MASYENLSIYKKALELAIFIEKYRVGDSRYHKYTIGPDMRDVSRNMVSLINDMFTLDDSIRIVPLYRPACNPVTLREQYRYRMETAAYYFRFGSVKKMALLSRIPYVVAGEKGYYRNGLKYRTVSEKLPFT